MVPIGKKNMQPNSVREMFALAKNRCQIETLSQLENMGIQHIRARTNMGFFLKVHAALLAAAFSNL